MGTEDSAEPGSVLVGGLRVMIAGWFWMAGTPAPAATPVHIAESERTSAAHPVRGFGNVVLALAGAQLDWANLTDAAGLVQEQIDAARGDGQARLPAGLIRLASWTTEDSGGP